MRIYYVQVGKMYLKFDLTSEGYRDFKIFPSTTFASEIFRKEQADELAAITGGVVKRVER